jgi:hypothetical protein
VPRREAAAELISSTAVAARPPGGGLKTGFLRQRLAAMAPDLAKLTNDPSPGVRRFAAGALGNIEGDPKLTVKTLETLMGANEPIVRRAAADALVNLVQIISQQEKRVRSDATRGDLHKDLLTTGTLVVPAAVQGLNPEQPVQVRRLCADALQMISSALAELAPEPFAADSFPPAGRPWTANEARDIEKLREQAAGDREELRPLTDAFGKASATLAAASLDPDPSVRIQVRRVLEDLAITQHRLTQRESRIPKGEGVPLPRPDTKPEERKEPTPKPGGTTLAPGRTPSGVPVLLVAEEKERPPQPAKPDNDPLARGLQSSLRSIVAGLTDRNVRGRIGAVEVLETMGTEAAPAIPALVERLSDPDRFVRWAEGPDPRPARAAPARPGGPGRRPASQRRRPRRLRSRRHRAGEVRS